MYSSFHVLRKDEAIVFCIVFSPKD